MQWLGAVQAQDYAAATWALAQRTKGIDAAGIDRLFDDGAILRTHILRPTWHFVLPADIRWMLQLTAPRVHASSAYYYRTLELDAMTFARSEALLTELLSGGRQLTRAEIAPAFADSPIDTSGLRLGFLLMHAELEAVICSGARKGKRHTYALLDDRVPSAPSLDGDAALSALAQRYFSSHGPAQLRDFCWWSGLTVAQAKRGIQVAGTRLAHRELDGRDLWFDPPLEGIRPVPGTLHLLPNFDEYLVAYKDRSAAFDRALGAATVSDVLGNVIVSDGQVIGEWRRAAAGDRVTIEAVVATAPGKVEMQGLRTACERYSRFLGSPVELKITQRS